MQATINHGGRVKTHHLARAVERACPSRRASAPLIALDADRVMCAGIRRLVQSFHAIPGQRYKDCLYPHRLRLKPWGTMLSLIVGAIDAARAEGRTLSRDDAHAPIEAMRQIIDAHLRRPLRPIAMLVREDTIAEGAANVPELALLQPHPSRADLERAREALAAQRRVLEEMDEVLAQMIHDTQRVA